MKLSMVVTKKQRGADFEAYLLGGASEPESWERVSFKGMGITCFFAVTGILQRS
jgi:hypothetical protein